MLYCTYDQYAAAGGTVPEAAFGVLCSRASRMIDAATFGRAEPHAAGCEACGEALADACAQIVGLLAAASAAGAVPGAASVSNDGYSVTFGSNASVTAAARQEAYEIREHFGKPVTITSGYRTASHNARVGGSKSSQHLLGRAADIQVQDTDPLAVAAYAESLMPGWGGVGRYPVKTGRAKGWVHVDTRPNKSRWTQ